MLTSRFEQAILLASELHAAQRRKGTQIPYVAHVLAVCAGVLEDGGDEDEAIAALLHDAAEDAGGRAILEEIRRRFGERVARIVEECSDTLEMPKPAWRLRKERYLEHLESASPEAVRVSLSDKLHNARAILRDYHGHGEELWKRFNVPREEMLWYYQSLAEIFRRRSKSSMARELAAAVGRLADMAR